MSLSVQSSRKKVTRELEGTRDAEPERAGFDSYLWFTGQANFALFF
jgi:hypothetical protein